MNILILHGYRDKGEVGWRAWLKRKLEKDDHNVYVPTLPNSNKPVFEDWMNFIEENHSQILDDDLIIIGHSLGGFLSLKLAENYKFKKIILVAPVGDIPKRISEKWLKERTFKHPSVFQFLKDAGQFDIEAIKNNNPNIVIYNSLLDKVLNEKIKKMVKDKISWARVIDLPDYGHFMTEEGVKKVPELLEEVEN